MYQIIICDKDFRFREEFHCLLEQVTQRLFMECSIIQCEEIKQVEKIFINKKSIDLLFLGIELGKKKGFKLGKYIREDLSNFHTQIVYVSQEPEYTIQLFETMPFDFLLKPIPEGKLQNMMNRFLKKQEGTENLFHFKEGKASGVLPYNKILYFQSVSPKLFINTMNDTKEFYGKLGDLEEQLPEYFVRIHKSYVVNAHFVRKYCYDSVILLDKQKLPISRLYKEQVRNYLSKHM